MDNQMNQKPRIAVANKAVVKAHGKYLILLKSDEEDVTPNAFDLPGGRMEYGESPQEALKREVKEEVNLNVSVKGVTDIWDFVMEKRKLQLVGITWACESEDISDQVKLSFEHSDHFWKSFKEVKNNKDEYPEWLVNSIVIAEKILD